MILSRAALMPPSALLRDAVTLLRRGARPWHVCHVVTFRKDTEVVVWQAAE